MRKSTLDDISYTVAAQRGRTAAVKKIAYDKNPYDRRCQPCLYSFWSKSHNEMRARMAMDAEGRDRDGAFKQ